MKPITPYFTPFTPDRVAKIRLNRELNLGEGLATHKIKKAKKAQASARARKPQPIGVKAQAQLSKLDPATRAMFEEMLKSK